MPKTVVRDNVGRFIKGFTYPKEWANKRVRPSGLKYKIKVINKSWFKRMDEIKLDEKGYERRHMDGKMKRMHKVILENKIGREFMENEVSHHLNGIRTDNRLENLVVMTKKEHDKLHNYKRYE